MKAARNRFPQAAVNLYGAVMELEPTGAVIQLQGAVEDRSIFRAGAPAEVIFATRGPIYLATTRIVSEEAGILRLAISESVRKVPPRQCPRYALRIPVSFRAVHERNSFGNWQEGTSEDIGVGGMGLLIKPMRRLTPSTQLLFMLPGDDEQGDGTTRLQADKTRMGDRSRPIKATARIVHSRLQPDGGLRLGLAFSQMLQGDYLRLFRFLDHEKMLEIL
jgi:hypothetical protein